MIGMSSMATPTTATPDVPEVPVEGDAVPPPRVGPPPRSGTGRGFRPWRIPLVWQLLIVVVGLAIWQWVPDIPGIRNVISWADPFFISSPSRCALQMWKEMTGADDTPLIWAPLGRTILTALIGTAAAFVVGSILGLLFSNWEMLNKIGRPFLVVANSLPKVTLIPVIVLIAKSSVTADAVTAFTVVVFLIFFNAYEGGLTVPDEMLQSAQLMGAGSFDRMLKIRWPFVMTWSLAQIPNAVSFGIVATVTTELFTGSNGIGGILITSIDTANANLTFAVVILLGVVSVVLIFAADRVRRVLLRWQ